MDFIPLPVKYSTTDIASPIMPARTRIRKAALAVAAAGPELLSREYGVLEVVAKQAVDVVDDLHADTIPLLSGQVSQAVFANHLNVIKDSVSQWERGVKRPAGPALKLLL